MGDVIRLYHFTSADNFASIRKLGLLPSVGAWRRWGKCVWFTTPGPQLGERGGYRG